MAAAPVHQGAGHRPLTCRIIRKLGSAVTGSAKGIASSQARSPRAALANAVSAISALQNGEGLLA